MSATTRVFRMGWDEGVQARAIGGALLTPRQAMQRHPSLTVGQIMVYLNGYEDGIGGDYFRLAQSIVRRAEGGS